MEQQAIFSRSRMHAGGRYRTLWIASAIVTLVLPAITVRAQLNQTLHPDGWILAAAHAPGEHGSIWRTDLWVYFDSYSGGSAELYFCTQGLDNSSATAYTLVAERGEKTVYVEDVADRYLNLGSGSWVGAIHYVADRNVQVYARVYSISADGSKSYGQMIEGIPTADMSIGSDSPSYPGSREDQWMNGTKHTSDGRFRVNVGAVNPTSVPTRIWFAIYDQGNQPPTGNAATNFDLAPYSMLQLSDPFAHVNHGDWNDYTIRVETEADGSGAFGYVSVVDNATNDAYFVRGAKRFGPNH